MKSYFLKFNNDILTLNLSTKINELPNANIQLKNTMITYPSNTYFLSLSIKEFNYFPAYIPILNISAPFDIITTTWNGYLTLNTTFASYLAFPFAVNPTTPTQTLCSYTPLQILNYFLTAYSCISNYFDLVSFLYNVSLLKVYRFEPNISFLDYLNFLQQFGFYWFIDWITSYRPRLYINHRLNYINKGNVVGGSKITITSENPKYNALKLIKEAYDDNIPRTITIKGDNPCVDIPAIQPNPSAIQILQNNNNLGVIGFNETGNKFVLYTGVDVGQCAGRTISDCNNQYAHSFVNESISNCSNPNCMPAGLNVRYCGSYKVGGEGAGSSILCNWTWNTGECITKIKIFAQGCTFEDNFPPTVQVVIKINTNYLCSPPPCIITNDTEYNFDKTQKAILISIPNNIPCNIAPYEITLQNINEALWNLAVNYYTFISQRPKRTIRIENPIFDNKPNVGYFYNIVLGNYTFNNCLLTSFEINTSDKGWTTTAEFEYYDT